MEMKASEERGDVSALRDEIEGLRAQRVELDRELIRRAYRIDELERTLRQTETEFRSSLSWRLTAPVRMLKALVGELLRR